MSPRLIGSCMVLPLLLSLQPAWADDASGNQVQQVIKLPLKLNKPPQAAEHGAAPAAKPAAEAKPAEGKPEGKPAEGKPSEAAKPAAEAAKKAEPAKAAPEKMEPGVPMAKPPTRDLSQPSPEVRAPGGKPRAAHRVKPRRPAKHVEKAAGEAGQVKGVVGSILKANSAYIAKHSPGYLAKLGGRAAPRATVVACSSPGGNVGMLGGEADADLFVISNLGNQLASSEGSIEYGVRDLRTPLLMFVSHTGCGAIKAAAGDYSNLGPAVQKELDNIEIPKGIDATNGALININNQVEGAILKFSGEVEAGRLAVLGGYYDFNNDLKQGRGKLVITNINGETDPARIRELIRSGRYFHYGFMGR
ncbi:carbonic anhydrase [Chromobacterium piscinae]|uniref:carbonic anhydrase n=1 Tax=Chromobacterium piscinae TaxID=686831 RepID=UPI001E5F36D0|nr:carbonic anhydrase [Chromobacterium piscinae]MCD4504996.1 carbonic anhydrase [Chromobacterium piscinae]